MDQPDPLDAEICLLMSRRRELVTEQTRRGARLRDLLSGLFPALERRINPTTRTGPARQPARRAGGPLVARAAHAALPLLNVPVSV
jgi:hypothetical protein